MIICPIEFLSSESDHLWAFNGTLNAVKALFTGVDYAVWGVIGVSTYGKISKMLLRTNSSKGNKGDDKGKVQIKRIRGYCRGMSFCIFIACLYKAMALNRMGKTMFKKPPCEGISWLWPIVSKDAEIT